MVYEVETNRLIPLYTPLFFGWTISLRLKITCLRVSYKKKKMKNIFFTSLKSLKKGIGSGVGSGCGAGSGSVSQRYGFVDLDPYPHQNVTDPQHCLTRVELFFCA